MLIFVKENLVFFATPKTGSTSIETTLGQFCEIRLSKNPNIKHTSYRKYKRLLEPFVNSVTQGPVDRIAAFREPVDWLGSWYRYRSRPQLVGQPKSTHGISFDQFIEAYLQEDPPEFADIGSQAKFMSTGKGKLGMTELFRYDQLDLMVEFLQNRLRKQINLPNANVSPKMDLTLDPKLRDRLQAQHPHDFEIYNDIKR